MRKMEVKVHVYIFLRVKGHVYIVLNKVVHFFFRLKPNVLLCSL